MRPAAGGGTAGPAAGGGTAGGGTAGPQFALFDPDMFDNISPFDMRITCLARCSSGMHLGLGNGMLLTLDTNSYKIKLVARRHLRALRVIAPLTARGGASALATFGEGVLDIRGETIPHAQCCSWSTAIGDDTEALSRYLEARKALVRHD